MSIRLIITMTAAPGRSEELGQALKARCEEVVSEPGCEQFEVFQSLVNPEKLILLEQWQDQAALDVHARVNETRARFSSDLVAGASQREDYTYNRTR